MMRVNVLCFFMKFKRKNIIENESGETKLADINHSSKGIKKGPPESGSPDCFIL
jgi:hypothetical protein